MPAIQVREGAGVVRIFQLDTCGKADVGDDKMLVLDTISEFGWEDVINDGDEVTERNFSGAICYTDTGANELKNVGINLTSCGINPAIDAFLMGSETIVDGSSNVTGFGRRNLTAAASVAVEVLILLEADACDVGSSAAPVASWIFPLVKNWKPAGGSTLNGTDLVKPQYSGQNYRSNKFFGDDGTEVPAGLAHWDGVLSTGNAAVADDDWYAFNIFDPSVETGLAAILASASDEPQEFLAVP